MSKRPASDAIIILGFAYALAMDLDPSGNGWGSSGQSIFRYFGYILVLLGSLPLALTRFPRKVLAAPTFYVAILLFAFIIGGGLLAALEGSPIEETFIGRSFTIVAYLAGLMIGASTYSREYILNRIAFVGISLGCVGLIIRSLQASGLAWEYLSQSLHVEFFYLVSGGVGAIAAFPRSRVVMTAVTSVIVYSAITSGKATSQILLVMFAAWLLTQSLSKHWGSQTTSGSTKWILTLSLAPAVAVGLIGAGLYIDTVLATRSEIRVNDLRNMMYGIRWEEFLDSPIFGTLFVGSPLINVPQLEHLMLPSHNDHLDILAHGGILAFSLWAYLHVKSLGGAVVRRGFLTFSSPAPIKYFGFLCLSYFVTSLANPISANPRIALPIWLILGIVAGLQVIGQSPSSNGSGRT